MPTIIAARTGTCRACGERIDVGEQIDYTRKRGATHAACAERLVGDRTNAHRARCHWCGAWVGEDRGTLWALDDGASHQWVVSHRERCPTPGAPLPT